MIHNPISLIGAILSKVSLPDRQFCIEIENKLFIDARTSANQVLWINALLGEIDVVSLNYLMSGNSSARDELALWFGKLLGRKQVCITVLQQSFLVVGFLVSLSLSLSSHLHLHLFSHSPSPRGH